MLGTSFQTRGQNKIPKNGQLAAAIKSHHQIVVLVLFGIDRGSD